LLFFFFNSVAQSYIFFFLALKWNKIMRFWYKKEKVFLHEPYKVSGIGMTLKVRLVGCIFFVFFLMEHFMFIGMEIHDNILQLEQCNAKTENYFKNYFRRERPHLLIAFPYYIWEIPIFQWSLMLMAFSWNYVDVFIIIVSMGLKSRFVQLNNRLRTTDIHQMNESFWSEIRIHYSNLIDLIISETIWIEVRGHYVLICELLEIVDHDLRFLILLSNLNNLYFICFQLLNIYEERRFVIDKIYFWYSVILLIVRASFLFIFASDISENSRKIMDYLRYIPSAGWCQEIERLSNQALESNGFTGMNFFHISRPLLFGLAGTILTYELVLLQFDGEEIDFSITC
ncbi:unnamed protein product, partial [Diamesa serratosioi]